MTHLLETEEEQADRNIYFLAANKIKASNTIILCSQKKTAT